MSFVIIVEVIKITFSMFWLIYDGLKIRLKQYMKERCMIAVQAKFCEHLVSLFYLFIFLWADNFNTYAILTWFYWLVNNTSTYVKIKKAKPPIKSFIQISKHRHKIDTWIQEYTLANLQACCIHTYKHTFRIHIFSQVWRSIFKKELCKRNFVIYLGYIKCNNSRNWNVCKSVKSTISWLYMDCAYIVKWINQL